MSRFKALSRGKEPQVLERWRSGTIAYHGVPVDNPNALEGWDGVLDINSDPVEAVSLKALLRENEVTLQGQCQRQEWAAEVISSPALCHRA